MDEFFAGKNQVLLAASVDCKLKSATREPKNNVFRIWAILDIVFEANFNKLKWFFDTALKWNTTQIDNVIASKVTRSNSAVDS